MLVYDSANSKYVVDPHYLSIIPLKAVYDSDPAQKKTIGEAKLMWIYHMYNPHSPFRDYRNKDKSIAIVNAIFPKPFLEEMQTKLQTKIDEAILKNQELDVISDSVVEGGEIKPKKKNQVFVPKLKLYCPEEDDHMEAAISWYKDHLKNTPLWRSVDAYKEAMYNLSEIISDPESNAASIASASKELDTIPLKMSRMKDQAVKDDAITLKVTGDRNIKKSEMIDTYNSRQRRKNAETAP